MLAAYCNGCRKIESFDGLHPFVAGWCPVYADPVAKTRTHGCAFNAPLKSAKKVKINPLKASKRGR